MKNILLVTIIVLLSLAAKAQTQNKTILPGGFYIGMSEQELRQYVKSNPEKLYVDPRQTYQFVHTKLDGIDYTVALKLYKGRLNSAIYMSNGMHDRIDDPKLKNHYQKLSELVKNLNTYGKIDLVYFRKTKVEWPYSIGTLSSIPMVDFFITKAPICDFISLSIDNDEGKFCIGISYISTVTDSEETLWKDIYFD